MPKFGKSFSPISDFDNNRPVALPDLLAGLVNNLSLGNLEPEVQVLTPEVMAPEELMPPATPVNTSMPEFLASLRTLLETHENADRMRALDVPSEAVQDFAHGTNELLNYLLHEVVGTSAAVPMEHLAGAAQDFGDNTNELLNYLLSQVAEPAVRDDTYYSPEAMADFAVGTQDLLDQLLAMTDGEELEIPPDPPAAGAVPDMLSGLMASLDSSAEVKTPEFELTEPTLEPLIPAIAVEPLDDPVDDDAAGDLLSELLANLTQVPADPVSEASTESLFSGLLANLLDAPIDYNLGEVPREYIDDSDAEVVERRAGPFELLLDAIDAELPPPPAIRGIVQQSATAASAGERFIAFELGDECYALPFDCVLETDRLPRWTHVPGVPAHLRGVLNLRGEIIPLIDLRALFGLRSTVAEGRMMVIRDRCNKTPVAFVVDRLVGLASVPANEITRLNGEGVVRGLATASGRKVGLLDADRVAAAAHGDHPLPRHTILTKHLEEQSYV